MHYLQNNWFITNWFWVLVMLMTTVSVVLYINNRKQTLKKSIVVLTCSFVIALFSMFAFSETSWSVSVNNNLSELQNGNQVESQSFSSKVVDYVLSVVTDKVSE